MGEGGCGRTAAESKTEQTVGICVLRERSRNGRGGLNSLGSGSHTTDNNFIAVDIAAGARLIPIRNVPRSTLDLRTSRAIILVMARRLLCRRLVGEDPEISGSSIKVQVDLRVPNRHRAQVRSVVLLRIGGDFAGLLRCGCSLDVRWRDGAEPGVFLVGGEELQRPVLVDLAVLDLLYLEGGAADDVGGRGESGSHQGCCGEGVLHLGR